MTSHPAKPFELPIRGSKCTVENKVTSGPNTLQNGRNFISRLPVELLSEIFIPETYRADRLLPLCLISWQLYHVVVPFLYNHVRRVGMWEASSRLYKLTRTVVSNPELARLVHTIELDWPESTSDFSKHPSRNHMWMQWRAEEKAAFEATLKDTLPLGDEILKLAREPEHNAVYYIALLQSLRHVTHLELNIPPAHIGTDGSRMVSTFLRQLLRAHKNNNTNLDLPLSSVQIFKAREHLDPKILLWLPNISKIQSVVVDETESPELLENLPNKMLARLALEDPTLIAGQPFKWSGDLGPLRARDFKYSNIGSSHRGRVPIDHGLNLSQIQQMIEPLSDSLEELNITENQYTGPFISHDRIGSLCGYPFLTILCIDVRQLVGNNPEADYLSLIEILPRSIRYLKLQDDIVREEQVRFNHLFELTRRKKELAPYLANVIYEASVLYDYKIAPDIQSILKKEFDKAEIELYMDVDGFNSNPGIYIGP